MCQICIQIPVLLYTAVTSWNLQACNLHACNEIRVTFIILGPGYNESHRKKHKMFQEIIIKSTKNYKIRKITVHHKLIF